MAWRKEGEVFLFFFGGRYWLTRWGTRTSDARRAGHQGDVVVVRAVGKDPGAGSGGGSMLFVVNLLEV